MVRPCADANYLKFNRQNSWYMQLINQFWRDDSSKKQFKNYQIPGSPPYWSSGFLSLQYAIEKAFIELVRINIYIYIIFFNGLIVNFVYFLHCAQLKKYIEISLFYVLLRPMVTMLWQMFRSVSTVCPFRRT